MSDRNRFEGPIIAHATKVRRITLRALWRAMGLTGHCEMCGGSTDGRVAFWPGGTFTEMCSPCLSNANRREGDGNA